MSFCFFIEVSYWTGGIDKDSLVSSTAQSFEGGIGQLVAPALLPPQLKGQREPLSRWRVIEVFPRFGSANG